MNVLNSKSISITQLKAVHICNKKISRDGHLSRIKQYNDQVHSFVAISFCIRLLFPQNYTVFKIVLATNK